MEFVFCPDCPTKEYDLSKVDYSYLDQQEFFQWFQVPHEEAPIEPQEDIFSILMSPQHKDSMKENIQDNFQSKRRKSSFETDIAARSKQINKVPIKKCKQDSKFSMNSTSSLQTSTRTTSILQRNSVVNSSHIVTSSSIAKTRSQSTGKARFVTGNTQSNELSLEQLLKEHNAKFTPIPAYEPPKHSVRDVRKWEKLTGKVWSELRPEERQIVNDEISKMKDANKLV
jgi:hypothetical protein